MLQFTSQEDASPILETRWLLDNIDDENVSFISYHQCHLDY